MITPFVIHTTMIVIQVVCFVNMGINLYRLRKYSMSDMEPVMK